MCGIRLRVGTVLLSELHVEGQTVLLLNILMLWNNLGFRYTLYSIYVPSTINNLPYNHTIVNTNVFFIAFSYNFALLNTKYESYCENLKCLNILLL